LAQHLGMTVAAPDLDYWLGLRCITSPVVYVDFEMDEEEQARRAFDVAAGMGFDRPPENFLYAECAGLTTAEAFGQVHELCRDIGAKFVIIDSLGMAIEGDSESSSDVLAFYRQYINPFRSAGVAPLIVDHQAKTIKGERYDQKEEFGSVYKRNSNRSVFQIDGEWAGSTFNGTLTHKKTNMGPQLDSLPVTIKFAHERISVARDYLVVIEDSTQDRILRSLRTDGPATNGELAERLGLELKDVQNRTGEMNKRSIEESGERRGRAKVWRLIPNEGPNANSRELGILGQSPKDPDEDAA
jgi:RecA-family ATPase